CPGEGPRLYSQAQLEESGESSAPPAGGDKNPFLTGRISPNPSGEQAHAVVQEPATGTGPETGLVRSGWIPLGQWRVAGRFAEIPSKVGSRAGSHPPSLCLKEARNEASSQRLYLDRTAGSDRDHRGSPRPDAAGRAKSTRICQPDDVPEQSQTDRP